ncbi:MAG TPA: histidine kinase dimerization/phosphoacceptor domain -containing protein [Ignavibacteriaceae bacterium]|nr:histidine kinase dimerization/phosphoacceptor domain -containing protein [Ignavibacteriaceae bacterium]
MKTKNDLLERIEFLENQLLEAEETIDAIKNDKVDALVISTKNGDQVYTLEGAERPYRIFLEKMNEGAITLSRDGVIIYCNSKFAELLKLPLETVIGSKIFQWIVSSNNGSLSNLLNNTNDEAKIEVDFIRSDGKSLSLYISIKRVLSEDRDAIFCIVATDLTEKKKNEEVVAAEKLARSILEQSADAIIVCDEEMKITRHSKAAEQLAEAKLINKRFDDVFPLFDINMKPIKLYDIVNPVPSSQMEIILSKPNGTKYNLIVNIGILTGQNNSIIGYVINLTNITEHIETEEKLSQSLKEKTVLLKEIHHRVKNNLQIISSLLRLQAMNIKDDSVIDILNECQNRITSMALIHQKLYESERIAKVNIASYMNEFVTYLCSTYLFSHNNINLNVSEDKFYFSIDTAVPMGLIINELVSNSFKHAFKNNELGFVDITIGKISEKYFTLIVKDNGRGFPENIDFYNADTLGLQLVNTLVQQINGSIEIKSSEKGTEIKMKFPMEDSKQ